jgi:glycosyltransferase involved in cell wall biosynthesis
MWSILICLFSKIEKGNKNVILIYSPHLPYVLASVVCKLFYNNIHICLYINDLPEYMSSNNNFIYRTAKRVEKFIFDNLLNYIDSFIVVTDLLPRNLKIENKPFIRIEGVYIEDSSVKELIENQNISTSNKFVILYSGTLDRRYGIDNLLQAFKLINNLSFELWICGFGDMESEIRSFQKVDGRIKYLGQKTHYEVIELQSKADVLVNPRLPIGEYTKYSFPIKTLEFLASTKPCIMYRLAGIPVPYYKFFHTPIDYSKESLANMILEVSNFDKVKLRIEGEKSRRFILEEVNIQNKFKELSDFFIKII